MEVIGVILGLLLFLVAGLAFGIVATLIAGVIYCVYVLGKTIYEHFVN